MMILESLLLKGKEMSNSKESLPVLEGYSLRQLTAEELPLLQALCERCAGLELGLSLEHIIGLPAGPSMAQDLARALSPGKEYDDKFLIGIFAGPQELVGVLMLDPAQRSKGLGESVCRAVEQWARDDGAHYIRLAVSAQNTRAHQFWKRVGFEELERRMRKLSDGQESVGIIMGHPLE
jgi:GNAT superfamily N-acetyltransferase